MAKAEANNQAKKAASRLTISPAQNATTTDPWRVTAPERYTKDLFLADLELVSRRITDEINNDPKEAALLRKRRKEARQGKTKPWKSDAST